MIETSDAHPRRTYQHFVQQQKQQNKNCWENTELIQLQLVYNQHRFNVHSD